ncbi:oxidoreductase [Pseudomonas syringae pv. lapsa]|uniref:Short-chain dehydrogenase/reductase SDR n=1 Tax=Pseudomonas syringae pv. lapsa TaxID=199201 RepID=A0AB73ZZA5_PSESX|nr:SDR family oxidoreductase [Pseudomonas syringae]ALU58555.1 oxidoreductase [Pseudomonas syringae pv. lapsa]KPX63754.1 Short-chain dehydrogenase/reductase SDR [Pseudomonas syringae pv. lapsa]RML17555.1 Short-chain dehydrogenase/reductase SDR [Pseudomonas syringae pv. lapsa]RML22222.1 Short-chain dehydrogenase/reductase SDR [Pseudomonas syringae pv. lapsa]
MSNIQDKVALITGASSGIGEAAARLIAAKGAHVVLGARRIERLQTLAADIEAQGGSARFRALDVTDALDMQAFADFAKHAFGKIDVIINNAGIMPLSPLAALNIAEWNQMLDVNVRGVLHGIAAVLPSMQAQGHGQIINISSIGGLAVSPTAAVYCATKFAVRAISDGLRQETDKIRVTVVCPGVVESELADSISDETARDAMKAFRKVALEPDAIARALVYAIEQPDGVDVSEIVVRPTGSAY